MIFKSSFMLLTVWARVSWLGILLSELPSRCPVMAEVVGVRANRGEGERHELFLEHRVEVFP